MGLLEEAKKKNNFHHKIDHVENKINKVENRVKKFQGKIKTIKKQVNLIQTNVSNIESNVQSIRQDVPASTQNIDTNYTEQYAYSQQGYPPSNQGIPFQQQQSIPQGMRHPQIFQQMPYQPPYNYNRENFYNPQQQIQSPPLQHIQQENRYQHPESMSQMPYNMNYPSDMAYSNLHAIQAPFFQSESSQNLEKKKDFGQKIKDKLKEKKGKKKKLKLTYKAHEIIPRNSPYSHNTRSLLNAERFLSEKEYQMTLDMYGRVLNKIPKKSITDKITQNINDIEEYLDSIEEEEDAPVVTLKIDPASLQDGDKKTLSLGAGSSSGQFSESTIKEIAKSAFEAQKAIFNSSNISIQSDDVKVNKEDDNIKSNKDKDNNNSQKTTSPKEDPPNQEIKSSEKEPINNSSDSNNSNESIIPGGIPALGGNNNNTTGSGASASSITDDFDEPMNEGPEALDFFDEPENPDEDEKETPPIQEIHGIMELKTTEEEDTPFLTLTYDFTKIPHEYTLSSDHSIFEFAYYKYKSMLMKAHKFIKKKHITKALNYYRVIREQKIPDEFRKMIDRNIEDITEYLEKYLISR